MYFYFLPVWMVFLGLLVGKTFPLNLFGAFLEPHLSVDLLEALCSAA